MSANQIPRSRIPKDEAKGRSDPQAPACTPSLKTSSTGSDGLYKPGFPHGLKLTGTMPAEVRRTEAGGGFAGSDPDEPYKGKTLNLYA
jgi:hypothetical protein